MLALTKVGAAYIPPFGHNPPMLGGAGSDPFDITLRMNGLDDFAAEWKWALNIKVGHLRLKVLPLERILASKQAANRPKDQRVIPVLENTLRTLSMKSNRRTKRKMKEGACTAGEVEQFLVEKNIPVRL